MADLDDNGHELRGGLRYPWPQAPDRGQVREVAPGVGWLRMPLPFRLDHINLYLLRHTDGWVAVDTGMNTDQTREVWERCSVKCAKGCHCWRWSARTFTLTMPAWPRGFIGALSLPGVHDRQRVPVVARQFPADQPPGWDFLDFYRKAGVGDEQSAEMFAVMSNAPISCRRH